MYNNLFDDFDYDSGMLDGTGWDAGGSFCSCCPSRLKAAIISGRVGCTSAFPYGEAICISVSPSCCRLFYGPGGKKIACFRPALRLLLV